MITKIPFRVDYPLEIFHPTKTINFGDLKEREDLFKRNIYSYLFKNKENKILEEKHEIFLNLNEKVSEYMKENYPSLETQSISLFGSSLFLKNPGDYDFLAITNGDIFLLDEPILRLDKKDVQTGISIKGVENYLKGFKKPRNDLKNNRLEDIIDRTTISLFRRHLPLSGKDFLNNNKQFLDNVYAQISDLINNAYDLFYLENKKIFIGKHERAKKILNRCYEAASYMEMLGKNQRVTNIRKEIYLARVNNFEIERSKKIFDRFTEIYEENVSKLI